MSITYCHNCNKNIYLNLEGSSYYNQDGIPSYKHCPKCKETKASTDFSRSRSRVDGLTGHCRECISKAHRVEIDRRIGSTKNHDRDSNPNFKHGMAGTRIYGIWVAMKKRCSDTNNVGYKYYGGKGIKVCDKWLKFKGFYEDMKEGYADDLSIERIDFNGDYCKENCTWIPISEQAKNTSHNRKITINGETKNMTDWCIEKGLDRTTFYRRKIEKGMTDEEAITTKIDVKKSLAGKGIKYYV